LSYAPSPNQHKGAFHTGEGGCVKGGS